MVTRKNVKHIPSRQAPEGTRTRALHVSFEGGICSLCRGHLAARPLARGGRRLRVTDRFQKEVEPKTWIIEI